MTSTGKYYRGFSVTVRVPAGFLSSVSLGALESIASNIPFIEIPILSGTVALVHPTSSEWVPPLVGAPFLTTFPVTMAVTANIRVADTRKRPAADATGPQWVRSSRSPPVGGNKVVTVGGTDSVVTNM